MFERKTFSDLVREERQLLEHGDPNRSAPYPHGKGGGRDAFVGGRPGSTARKDRKRPALVSAGRGLVRNRQGQVYDAEGRVVAGGNTAAAADPAKLRTASIGTLANIIRRDWSGKGKGINYAAKPYLSAMASMDKITDNYGADRGESIVAYFLGNAHSWTGPVAKAVKAELNRRLSGKEPKAPGPPRGPRKTGVGAYVAALARQRKLGGYGRKVRPERFGITDKEGFEAWSAYVKSGLR